MHREWHLHNRAQSLPLSRRIPASRLSHLRVGSRLDGSCRLSTRSARRRWTGLPAVATVAQWLAARREQTPHRGAKARPQSHRPIPGPQRTVHAPALRPHHLQVAHLPLLFPLNCAVRQAATSELPSPGRSLSTIAPSGGLQHTAPPKALASWHTTENPTPVQQTRRTRMLLAAEVRSTTQTAAL